ncbi:MAG: tetratricopeptide repeat protein, partial [Comamonas sp.]|nr:tetratricopeptide repeat protein [Comamonas sp.]
MHYQTIVEQLWAGQVSFAQLLQHIEQLQAQGHNASATTLYLAWLESQPTDHPANAFAWFNLGVQRLEAGRPAESVQAYEAALRSNPQLWQARCNLGLALERQGNLDAALAQWQQVMDEANPEDADQRPLLITALNSHGRVSEARKDYGSAISSYNRSLAINPLQTDVLHHWIFVRARQCLWPVYEAPEGVDEQVMRNSTSALAQLALYDDPATQLQRARNYAEQKAPAVYPALAQANGYGHKKLRIAYCSSDFCTHPVAMLTVELIERHNREQFEVYGFCWSPDDESPLRQRIVQAFDHYIPVHHLDEAATAQLIRQHEIDILIDLQGQTSGARMQAMALRPAPVQITYLGLPATTGMPTMDFVIGDHYLIPEENAQHYSEQVIYMPDVYQSSDSQRQHNAPLTKKAYGLPGRKLIFCSFN